MTRRWGHVISRGNEHSVSQVLAAESVVGATLNHLSRTCPRLDGRKQNVLVTSGTWSANISRPSWRGSVGASPEKAARPKSWPEEIYPVFEDEEVGHPTFQPW